MQIEVCFPRMFLKVPLKFAWKAFHSTLQSVRLYTTAIKLKNGSWWMAEQLTRISLAVFRSRLDVLDELTERSKNSSKVGLLIFTLQ